MAAIKNHCSESQMIDARLIPGNINWIPNRKGDISLNERITGGYSGRINKI